MPHISSSFPCHIPYRRRHRVNRSTPIGRARWHRWAPPRGIGGSELRTADNEKEVRHGAGMGFDRYALWSRIVSGSRPWFVSTITTVLAGRPSAEEFDRSPPRQLAPPRKSRRY